MIIYFIRNKSGKFFRSKGYGGYGDSWVDTMEKAKMYTRIGTAKAQITFWFRRYPLLGCPDLLSFSIDPAAVTVIDMTDDTVKRIQKATIKELRREERNREWRLESAQRDLDKARAKVEAYSKKA